MWQSNSALRAIAFCFALLAAACATDDGPTAPTDDPEPEPEPVTLTGTWSGTFEGVLVAGDGQATLTHDGTDVTGEWSVPMSPPLLALGAPADVDLGGPVTGVATGTTAELSFGFLDVFEAHFGGADCALDVSVSSFDETTMEATWATSTDCTPATDEGTLSFTRQ